MGGHMQRRQVFQRLLGFAGLLSFAGLGTLAKAETGSKKLKIVMRSSWGSDDPTRASFPFLHALILADAGHEVQIFLTGEATGVLRKATAAAIVPVGWPPLQETLTKIAAKHIPVFA